MSEFSFDRDRHEQIANELLDRAVTDGLTEAETAKLHESVEALSLLKEMDAVRAILNASTTIHHGDGTGLVIVSEQALLAFVRDRTDLPTEQAEVRIVDLLDRMDATRRQGERGEWLWEIPFDRDRP
jgi:hypothetical protein